MWKDPSKPLELCAQGAWNLLGTLSNLWTKSYPSKRLRKNTEHGHDLLKKTLGSLITSYLVSPSSPRVPKIFHDEFVSLILRLVREAEGTEKDFIIGVLSDASAELAYSDKEYANFARYITFVIQLMLGNEHRFLIGFRDGKPVWKNTNLMNLNSRSLSQVTIYLEKLVGYWEYFDRSDVDFLPDFTTALQYFPENTYPWPEIDLSTVKGLLEDAYYNERFLVNPKGVYVKLNHFGPYKGLNLKVKYPGLRDPNYFDLICTVDIDPSILDPQNNPKGAASRQRVFVIDGAFAQGSAEVLFLSDAKAYLYLTFIAVLVYHDLVTAKEVNGRRLASNQKPGNFSWDFDESESSWVYIQRKVYNRPSVLRVPSENPRSVRPHHVTGHKRRANPTPKHIRELEEFEKKTGLKVTELLRKNPGYTVVRPTVSPRWEDVTTLPKFIHARLQSEIEEMMKPTLKED